MAIYDLNPKAQTADSSLILAGDIFLEEPYSLRSNAWRQFRRHHLAMISAVVFLLLLLGTIVGPFLYRVPIDAIDFGAALHGPSLAHPFGTDDLGHDLFARVLFGGRVSIAVGVAAMLIGIVFGTFVGALAGFFGGMIDALLMRLTDIFQIGRASCRERV